MSDDTTVWIRKFVEQSGSKKGSNPSVLIVDDDQNIGKMTKTHFEAIYDMKIVTTLALAKEEINRHPPDAILLDVVMPDGDGIQFCRELKTEKRTRTIPVILITGKALSQRLACLEAGAEDFLVKPLDLIELAARLKTCVRTKQLIDENLMRYATEKELRMHDELLTSMIIHDLKNPLSAVMGFIRMLQMQPRKLDEQAMSYTQSAIDACQQLLEMINQITDVMRMEDKKMPLRLEKQDILLMVQRKVKQYEGTCESTGIAIKTELPSSAMNIAFDSSLISRALENLIINAIKHTPRGGQITVGVTWPTGTKSVMLWVKDSGEGIPKEHQGPLFQKYGLVQLKKLGRSYDTGLGLFFCRMVVELHGGKIHVASEIGKGSIFTIELPLYSRRC